MEKTNALEPKKETPKIKMYDVHSTKLSKIGWYFCQETMQGVCVAEFPKGARYMYFPITQQEFSGMFSTHSKGQYFTENIEKKPGVRYVKLGQPKLNL